MGFSINDIQSFILEIPDGRRFGVPNNHNNSEEFESKNLDHLYLDHLYKIVTDKSLLSRNFTIDIEFPEESYTNQIEMIWERCQKNNKKLEKEKKSIDVNAKEIKLIEKKIFLKAKKIIIKEPIKNFETKKKELKKEILKERLIEILTFIPMSIFVVLFFASGLIAICLFFIMFFPDLLLNHFLITYFNLFVVSPFMANFSWNKFLIFCVSTALATISAIAVIIFFKCYEKSKINRNILETRIEGTYIEDDINEENKNKYQNNLEEINDLNDFLDPVTQSFIITPVRKKQFNNKKIVYELISIRKWIKDNKEGNNCPLKTGHVELSKLVYDLDYLPNLIEKVETLVQKKILKGENLEAMKLVMLNLYKSRKLACDSLKNIVFCEEINEEKSQKMRNFLELESKSLAIQLNRLIKVNNLA